MPTNNSKVRSSSDYLYERPIQGRRRLQHDKSTSKEKPDKNATHSI